jgi:hypothetical protein
MKTETKRWVTTTQKYFFKKRKNREVKQTNISEEGGDNQTAKEFFKNRNF